MLLQLRKAAARPDLVVETVGKVSLRDLGTMGLLSAHDGSCDWISFWLTSGFGGILVLGCMGREVDRP